MQTHSPNLASTTGNWQPSSCDWASRILASEGPDTRAKCTNRVSWGQAERSRRKNLRSSRQGMCRSKRALSPTFIHQLVKAKKFLPKCTYSGSSRCDPVSKAPVNSAILQHDGFRLIVTCHNPSDRAAYPEQWTRKSFYFHCRSDHIEEFLDAPVEP